MSKPLADAVRSMYLYWQYVYIYNNTYNIIIYYGNSRIGLFFISIEMIELHLGSNKIYTFIIKYHDTSYF